ncbi:hypothetical protein FRB90_003347 [Tulasnella sp. 427]|nr:hypothetical protein FRB90_003347 [Tulasnella sp. 427]
MKTTEDRRQRRRAAGDDPEAVISVETGRAPLAIEATKTVETRIETTTAIADEAIGTGTVVTAAGALVVITTKTMSVAETEVTEVTRIGIVSGTGSTGVASVTNPLMANASRRANDAEMTLGNEKTRWMSTKTRPAPIRAPPSHLALPSVKNVIAALRPVAPVETVVPTIAPLAMMTVTAIGTEILIVAPDLEDSRTMMTAGARMTVTILPGASLLVTGMLRPSPGYDPHTGDLPPQDDDSEARSVFVSQLAARLTARDLGYFFEDKLGEGTVRDSRIVTDRISRRSKGIAYVELGSIELVQKAIALTGTVVMGLPIMVQLTESERNKQAPAGDSLNLPPGVNAPPVGMQLYVGSLHFNLSESDIQQVFEPFGELEFVDLHKDPQTGRSKGYAFVQYKRAEDAKMALQQMDGFELAGRQLRVNTVHDKGSTRGMMGGIQQDSLDEGGGTNLNSVSRQALMQKLARTEPAAARPAPIMKPTNIPATMKSRCILLKNMFNPEEETEPDWHKELQTDVKDECEAKYGKVDAIKVEVESQGEIYLRFATVEDATKAIEGLNGRWFGGNQVSAAYISDAIMDAHL